jgi:septum formation protein
LRNNGLISAYDRHSPMNDFCPVSAVDLILASSSSYRRDLLQRLTKHFRQLAPDIDESAAARETPAALALRLAIAKAKAVAAIRPGAIVIGSDQVAALGTQMLGKPGDHENARAQLLMCSGQTVSFHTALCLIDGRDGRVQHAVDTTHVYFRNLDSAEIEAYLHAEQPYDCAGSFKAEGLGITLFTRMQSDDPTALIGLPLIALNHMLRTAGIALF